VIYFKETILLNPATPQNHPSDRFRDHPPSFSKRAYLEFAFKKEPS
jgi:hypothetical protein